MEAHGIRNGASTTYTSSHNKAEVNENISCKDYSIEKKQSLCVIV